MLWIRHIDDHQELVVVLVVRREVARAGGQIGVVPIGEPDEVDPARVRTGRIEMRELLRHVRIGDIVGIQPRAALSRLLSLVCDHEHVAG